ncbi:MAG: ribosome maturation factor RimP [Clostridia bacterium]|nr:ribosome maturation factor RimP [Clostridia bacterium]
MFKIECLAKALNNHMWGNMKFKPVEEINLMLKEIADPMGIEIVEVECNEKAGSLTVYIETETGVDLDTCEKFHNAILDPIDEVDPSYGEPYTLNVSSPGLDRPFKTQRDFERNTGKEIELKLYAPLKGKKFLQGVLVEFDENSVTVELPKETVKIPRNKIAKINKAIKFE